MSSFKIILFLALAASIATNPLYAQRKKVGVVLSGGGAKGVAHITALKVIEEAGIPIDYIAGTSMGAIIGGLYAIGYDTDTLDSLVRTQNWTELLSDRVSRENLTLRAKESKERYMLTIPLTSEKKLRLPSGLVGGYNVYNLLYEMTIEYHDSLNFHDLPIPFACVAYDMVTGDAVVLDKGYLPDAIRASMSIPGAFQPVENGDMLLVDGGIGNNFPADVVRDMGAEIIIGVDVTAPLKTKEELKSVTDLVDQLTSFIGQESYEENLKLVDLYVHPNIESYTAASFSAAAIDTLLVRGETAMREKWDDLIALKDEIGIPRDSRFPPRQHAEVNKVIMIDNIYFEGLKYQQEKPLRRAIGIRENTLVTTDELYQAVSKLQGTNSLSEVHYRLEGHSPYTLTFIVKEKSRNTLSLGFGFNTEEMAALSLNVTLAGRFMSNSYFDISGRLSDNPYIKGAYIIGAESKQRLTLSYMFRYYDLNVYSRGDKLNNLDFNEHRFDINFSNINFRNFKIDLGLRYDYYHFRSMLGLQRAAVRYSSQGLIEYYATAHMENLDNRYYPRKGNSLTAKVSLTTSNFVTYKGEAPYGAIQFDYFCPISPSKRVSIIPGAFARVLIGDDFAFASKNFIGGVVAGRYLQQQIPFVGVQNFEMVDNAFVGVKLDLRVRLWMKNYVSLRTNFAMQDDDFFNILKGTSMFGLGLGYSYDSFIGPIDFIIDWSDYTKKVGFYFNLGYYF